MNAGMPTTSVLPGERACSYGQVGVFLCLTALGGSRLFFQEGPAVKENGEELGVPASGSPAGGNSVGVSPQGPGHALAPGLILFVHSAQGSGHMR